MLLLPPPNVLWTLVVLLALLAIATLAIKGWQWTHPQADLDSLQARMQSWWVILTCLGIALLLNRGAVVCFFALVSFLSLKEYLSLIPTRRVDRRVLFCAYLAIPIQYLWVWTDWYVMFLIFVPVYMFLFLPMRMLISGETEGFLRAIGTLHWGMMLTVFSLGHIAYLLMLNPAGNPGAGGAGLLLYLLILTEGNDIAQYCWGKSLGRHRIVPTLSPNKTWEGWMGGLLTTVLLAIALAPGLTPFPWPVALVLGLLLAMAGFIGDVTLSALKRDLGVKDSGTLLPGHGGILDRIDSLTYTAPLFFHLTVFFYFPAEALAPGSQSIIDQLLRSLSDFQGW
ncbi:phosphatidate cytidylyltransferase [Lyngbya confervoides]|uniref:Phosphatidate cytidylyltransferase n=1 Tax=Lyngbya confervoides BDU141951 TaxID=1574623 RepID=A0ABD4T4D9_9CYAN|nr:phosphatidate cytidylyltransferase [Lyngbya confervoides]MCM1983691.1 phosphatidate cytidylyltransferase [Lyngbya confervoides BDU141951]